MYTQRSSKPRLKNSNLGEADLNALYGAYSSDMPLVDFEALCVSVVQRGGGGQVVKDAVIRSINAGQTRARSLAHAQNFIMAGMGLGV